MSNPWNKTNNQKMQQKNSTNRKKRVWIRTTTFLYLRMLKYVELLWYMQKRFKVDRSLSMELKLIVLPSNNKEWFVVSFKTFSLKNLTERNSFLFWILTHLTIYCPVFATNVGKVSLATVTPCLLVRGLHLVSVKLLCKNVNCRRGIQIKWNLI